jgi:hypothetical protein
MEIKDNATAGKVANPRSFMGANGVVTEGVTIENAPNDETVALTEPKEQSAVSQQNLKYQGAVSYVQERFRKAKDARYTDEQRWLKIYKNFRGQNDVATQFSSKEKSKAFIKITKTKVLAAYAQVVDILFSGNKFPLGVESSKVPDGIEESVHVDPKEPMPPTGQSGGSNPTIARPEILKSLGPLKKQLEQVQDKLKPGPGLTPTALTWEPAKEAAKRMDDKFQDQLAEAGADKTLRAFAFELALFGHGVYKGPISRDKEYPKWTETGEYEPEIKQVADFMDVSIWNSYPDPDARNIGECEFFIERHKMSKSQLRALKKRPFFRPESIELAIADGFSYQEEYWENDINDYKNINTIERYEVLEYWGNVDKDFIDITDTPMPKEFKGKDQVQVNIFICNGQLLRMVYNQFTPARLPYYACPYELNPYSFFGVGVAENMMDTQLAMNGFFRMAIDNAAISNNTVLEVNETMLVPGQDMEVYPGKIFRTQGQLGQSIHSIKIDNHSQENFMMFDKARQLADESTGIPSYAHGQGGVQGIGRTAAGMSMLMGAAAQNIKAVVRNIDDYLLVPLGKSLFAFNMQFDFDKDFIGDLEVVARGTESLMRDEIRSQKVMQFLQATANPMDAPFVKRDYLLRELAESLDLEADKVVNDPREAGLQAMAIKDMMLAQGIDPNKQQGQGGANGAGTPPGPQDPTGNGNGNVAPGAAPTPGEQGNTGTGGGSNRKAA